MTRQSNKAVWMAQRTQVMTKRQKRLRLFNGLTTDDKQEKNGCDGSLLARLHADRQLILNAPQDAKKDFMQFPEMDASFLNVKQV
jgi:hypothetical protein